MDILFITPEDKSGLKRAINGTLLLATILLQNGISTDILRYYQFENYKKNYEAFINDVAEASVSQSPRCVSFYNMWPYFHINLSIARRIKELSPDTSIVMGGPLTTLYPQTVLERISWVDYVCCGEGENTIVPFMQALLSGQGFENVPGLYYRIKGDVTSSGISVPLSNLNELPQWNEKLLTTDPRKEADIASYSYYMPIDVGRGCPFNCTFCCSNRVWKRKYRLKTPERIVEDIRYHYETYGIRSFLFSHDAFTVNARLVSEVCDLIIESGMDITWDCTTRVNCVNEELLQKMIKAGMRRIQMGVETGSSRMQALINKKLDLEHLRRIVTFLQKNKIDTALFFMYGFPEETEADLNETINLFLDFLEMGVQYMSMALCNFNPGTELTDKYFDRLSYPSTTNTKRVDIFGYQENEDLIKRNKELFPFFYHLSTPLRDEYYFLERWALMCRKLPKAVKFVRKIYGRDGLGFYRDFVENNPQYIDFDCRRSVQKQRRITPGELLLNTIRNLEHPKLIQLKALVEFLGDNEEVSASKTDIIIQKTYDFSYLDYIKKLSIDNFSAGKTEIKLSKINSKLDMKILDMQ